MSLAERKQIAQQMRHSLSTHMQYSKHISVQRLNQQPTTISATVEKPTIKQTEKRSTAKISDYDENKKQYISRMEYLKINSFTFIISFNIFFLFSHC
jgi:hypothetical protein